jgi:hypothetical protein
MRKIRTVKEPPKPKPLGASDFCYIGAAEAMKYGATPDARKITRKDYQAVEKARDLFEQFTNQQMAVALLILMVDLGKRIDTEGGLRGL